MKIELRNIYKSFGEREILRGVNLTIKPGRTTVIFGTSGGGKSTIIKLIVRLIEPNRGDILIGGENITQLSIKRLYEIRKQIGFLFQSGALFDSKNVFENVAFPLREHTLMSEKEIYRIVCEKLELVGLKPNVVLNLFPDELSGGMKKRVGLARSIAMNPKVILYDEPTSGLDPISSNHITQMIRHLQDELHVTSILISHDIKESFKSADDIAMLFEGKIIEYGTKEEFAQSKREEVIAFIR
ncbi:ABC transporter ATP-binding protein [Helicobacter monodelphidis]|uniref:ABC transporter ATP-binding protein n=1 Tax=Helicobacter sp. 15-1451 TaxID=2004995 RepID=UPI000DCD23CA|nr:ABC transporter ATP-binding protein [Helicobacter sp. 15-1451]RAX57421.1 ABC transporter ATP-binding protein [Helicobacter sp. 15-1451]